MQNQNSTVSTTLRGGAIAAQSAKPLHLAVAVALGMVMLYAVGFIETSAVHSVAHDMRHAMGFPCH